MKPAAAFGGLGGPFEAPQLKTMNEFLRAAVEEAERGLAEGGIPIGSVLVHRGRILGRGRNRRVQRGRVVLHGEMDALENAGRRSAQAYRERPPPTGQAPDPGR